MTLSNKYNEVMDKIEVTEEMRSRILQNIANEFSEDNNTEEAPLEDAVETPIDFGERAAKRKKAVYSFTRYIGVAAAAVVLFIGATAVLDKSKSESTSFSDTAHELTHDATADLHNKEAEFIKNSWVKYESVEKMAQATGVEFKEIEYLNSVSSDVDYYLDNGTDATIVYDVSGNSITLVQKQEMNVVAEAAEEPAASEETNVFDAKAGNAEKNSDRTEASRIETSKTVTETITVGDVNVQIKGTDEGFNKATWTVDGIEYSLDSAEKLDLDGMTDLIKNILAF